MRDHMPVLRPLRDIPRLYQADVIENEKGRGYEIEIHANQTQHRVL
jgi:hypothetical protein